MPLIKNTVTGHFLIMDCIKATIATNTVAKNIIIVGDSDVLFINNRYNNHPSIPQSPQSK